MDGLLKTIRELFKRNHAPCVLLVLFASKCALLAPVVILNYYSSSLMVSSRMQVLKKADMIRKNAVESILAERDILISVRNPFVVRTMNV
jgi:hypothetical protein